MAFKWCVSQLTTTVPHAEDAPQVAHLGKLISFFQMFYHSFNFLRGNGAYIEEMIFDKGARARDSTSADITHSDLGTDHSFLARELKWSAQMSKIPSELLTNFPFIP